MFWSKVFWCSGPTRFFYGLAVLRSRSRYFLVEAGAGVKVWLPAPAPGSGSTLDKAEEILNDILFICSKIY